MHMLTRWPKSFRGVPSILTPTLRNALKQDSNAQSITKQKLAQICSWFTQATRYGWARIWNVKKLNEIIVNASDASIASSAKVRHITVAKRYTNTQGYSLDK
jgi:hypothetical protein